ncbi:DUF3667 domain-containing protein [Flavobacterium caeni]|uniref:DUF3667 domain-containing protein n=1 Tax=Flavobacterium caeni TaxID=490189 RepID=A0A1G5CGJ7_9FLAO|nr:DUF3667 domain-containing protein [Flavobacterium caeni]SCY01599.1 Protein of unknown function [Flavobacterium caeni]
MGNHQLRKDMTCLNCRHVVEKRYCPNCGQENSDTRKTFHHLFVHFFEDLTHYENSFWKTIRNLLFRPGALTKEYMSGKRMSYLAPVRLYIFISFVTFFLIGVLPQSDSETTSSTNKPNVHFKGPDSPEVKALTDSLKKQKLDNGLQIGEYESVQKFDSVQQSLPKAKRATGISHWLQRRLAKVNGENTREEFGSRFGKSIIHNIPKALFLYMPFFALFLWLFHDKKRHYYFDSGIFTLHYFSFLLLTLSLYVVTDSVTYAISESLNDSVAYLVIGMMCWWFFYFFRSHRRFFGESRWISRAKGLLLFIINMTFLGFFMLGLMLYTALNLE